MNNRKRHSGFTLTEVLISAGILSIGFMLIAGAFPVGVKLTTMATQRTIGATTAQEAEAKMKIHGIDMSYWNSYYVNSTDGLTYGNCFDYSDIARLDWSDPSDPLAGITPGFRPVLPSEDDYYYPSTNLAAEKKYHWSALCRLLPNGQVLATIFVSRLGGLGVKYPANPIPIASIDPALLPLPTDIDYPEPYMIEHVEIDPGDSTGKTLIVPPGYETFFREGAVVVDDLLVLVGNPPEYSQQRYTIQERVVVPPVTYAVLDRPWQPGTAVDFNVWVIPSSIKPGSSTMPQTLGGRWPCVWVFQYEIPFQNFSNTIPVP